MTGERDLNKLLNSISPVLISGEYVYCSFANAQYGDYPELEPIAGVSESEGLTLIVPKSRADERGVDYVSVFSLITLTIHSSLDAVGMTAAFADKLTEHGISANVVAGYYHDHIFVQSELAEQALKALNELAC